MSALRYICECVSRRAGLSQKISQKENNFTKLLINFQVSCALPASQLSWRKWIIGLLFFKFLRLSKGSRQKSGLFTVRLFWRLKLTIEKLWETISLCGRDVVVAVDGSLFRHQSLFTNHQSLTHQYLFTNHQSTLTNTCSQSPITSH